MKTTIEKFKLDKNSEAVRLMKKSPFFKEALEDDADRFEFASRVVQAGLEFGLDLEEDLDEEIAKTVVFYGVANLRAWCKYQQTYTFASSTVLEAVDRIPAEVIGEDILLPFPALMAIMTVQSGDKVGFLMRQVGNGIDVVAIIGQAVVYFPLNDETVCQIEQERVGGFLLNDDFITLAGYAYFVTVVLSVYREKREILRVNRVIRRGKPRSNELKAAEWRTESVITEKLPDSTTSLKAAFDLDDLIPPSERDEEIVESEHTHASPRRHHVRTHTCVYWTGPGRKIPVVRVIESYERGGSKNDSAGGTKRKVKTKSKSSK
ncbi:hypothetical protein IKF28_02280 [Candidatus Saccharibacteria bacterium]|nr:hypothetical protein [Candidatus Saccharibacteria bacterium]